MALKCPFCSAIAHCRASMYEAPSVKKTYYQCTNLECSATFTALESVHTIITRPQKESYLSDSMDEQEQADKPPQTLNRYGSASKLSGRQQIPV